MRDDDYDRQRSRRESSRDFATPRERVPGKGTLAEGARDRELNGAENVPGKRTLAAAFDTPTQGGPESRDPVTETEFHVRKARELIGKLGEKLSPTQKRVLRADLRCHLDAATHAAPLAFTRANGREVATEAFQLIAEAASHLGTVSGAATIEETASTDPEVTARRGVEGQGERLPHFDTIQRLFGAHDVSNVKAHIGGPAAEANRELGAQAYAHGNDVAFAEQPGLHLVAHEAAHVVQQRAGIAFKNGEIGDAFEKHADAVADAVVRGHSAEPLLSGMVGSGSTAAPSRPVIQRKPVGDASQVEAFAPSREFARYVQVHAVDLGQAVARQLANTIWPDPTEDTPFTRAGERRFSQRLSALVRDQLDQPEHLVMMLYPGNALERFQQYIIAPGQLHNQAYRGFGEPFAQLVEVAAKESLTKRVGPRYAQLLSRGVRSPKADDIIAGHPIDPIVAVAVCEEGVLNTDDVGTVKDIGPVKVNHVDVHWLGRQNAELWNFVQAIPSTATAEEVAASLWGDPKKTTMAFALEKYGDVFRVAPAYARQVLAGRYPSEPIGASDVDASRAKQIVALVTSSVRNGDAATAEFTGEQQAKTANAAQIAGLEIHIGTLLDHISMQLARVAMDKLLEPAYAAREARAKILAGADPATRSRWMPVLSFQHTQLLSINAQLPAAVQAYQKVFAVLSFGNANRRRAHDEAQAAVRDYAAAAGTSHLRDESTAIMRRIEQRQQAAAQDQLDATAAELHESTTSSVDTGGRSMLGNADADHDIEQQRQIAQNRGKTSQYDRRKALVAAGEQALLARMDSAQRSLLQLQEAADAAGFADGDAVRAILRNAKLKSFPEVITDVRDHLAEVHRVWVSAINDPKNRPEVIEEGAPQDWDDWQAREVALPIARSEFAKIAGDQPLGEFIHEAVKKIQVQRIVNALATLAEALLLTVVAGAGAAAIARAAATLVAEQGTLAFAGVEIAANASINSLVQMAVSGDGNASFGWTMLENGLMDMFSRGLLRPMKNAEDAARAEVREIAALPHLTDEERAVASSASFIGTHSVADLVSGMASQWAARHIVDLARSKVGAGGARDEGISDSFALTALQQGAAIGLGKFFHGRLESWRAHRKQLEQTRFGALPEAKALIAAREEFFKDAARLEANPSPDPAEGDRLNQRNIDLYKQERALIAAHAGTDGSSSYADAQERANGAHDGSTLGSSRDDKAVRVASHPAGNTHAAQAGGVSTQHGAAPTPASEPEKQFGAPPEKVAPASGVAEHKRDAAPTEATALQASEHAQALEHALDDLVKSAPQLVAEFPQLRRLPPTQDNVDGLRRLTDLYDDVHLPPDLREQFLAELKERVGSSDVLPDRLHDEMYKVAHAKPDVYLRKGARPTADHIEAMGGLRRAVSLKATLASLTTDAWYASVADVAGVPRDRAQFNWRLHADKLVEAYKEGKITFDTSSDLNPNALVKGAAAGSSGWYFSAADAGEATSSPEAMQTQLAVGAEYTDGYIILVLPTDAAIRYGAAKPTAIDLTLSSAGKLNKNPEPAGRTAPTKKGQKEVREVVLPPVPLSVMANITFVRGSSK